MSFGRYLQEIRKRTGLTQGDVALMMGWKTSQFISNIERDVCYPPAESIEDLAKIYKYPVQTLKDKFIEAKTYAVRERLDKILKGKKKRNAR